MKRFLSRLLALMLILNQVAGAAAVQEPLRVVTSFYPLHLFAQNILKDVPGVVLQNLTHPTTGCLHDYQLLASDMKTLSQADILIINGGGMEGFLAPVTAQFPDLVIVDSSQGVELIPEEELLHGQGETEAEHAAHDHGAYNAHIWLDPANAIQMTRTIAGALAGYLPDQADRIAANALSYTDRLLALDLEIRETLQALQRRDIVTFHEAFPYFARAYGLHVVAVMALEPEQALTPAMLSALVDKVIAAGLPPLFTEPQYEDRAARAVAQETGARIFELDPIVTGNGEPDAYETGMRRNAQVLLAALGGN
ncbi:MAG: metal ABC transporter substrate-binding protein [Christensenellales bacterium]